MREYLHAGILDAFLCVQPALRTRSRFCSSAVGPKIVDLGVETGLSVGEAGPKRWGASHPTFCDGGVRFDPKNDDAWPDRILKNRERVLRELYFVDGDTLAGV